VAVGTVIAGRAPVPGSDSRVRDAERAPGRLDRDRRGRLMTKGRIILRGDARDLEEQMLSSALMMSVMRITLTIRSINITNRRLNVDTSSNPSKMLRTCQMWGIE
jgi:hypothetical protein